LEGARGKKNNEFKRKRPKGKEVEKHTTGSKLAGARRSADEN